MDAVDLTLTEFAARLSLIFAALVALNLLLDAWLVHRQVRHVSRHRGQVPPAFAGRFQLAAHQRSADYTLDRMRVRLVESAWGAALILGWTLLGGLDTLNQFLRDPLVQALPGAWGELLYQITLIVAVLLIGSVLDLPIEAWRTFGVEQRHGFNRQSPRLFLADALRGTLLTVVIAVPLLAAILALMGHVAHWWLWVFAVWMGFQLLSWWAYPAVIAPMFNRFEPLQDAALTGRIDALMKRCGFELSGLYVVDGSRRSAHANAYFTGIGSSRRVVFYDTLLDKLSPDEIEAVLAHELGHCRRRHVTQRMLALTVLSLVALAGLAWLTERPWFYTGLGVNPNLGAPNDALALLLFMTALPVMTPLLRPLAAAWSRRQEYEADDYACRHATGQHLAQALVKLHEDNASTLTPDPWFVRFHYSHPPALERLEALPCPA